ncbi:hypothetical protein [Pseudomonas sp. RIT-PI-S]|nr:hypothetical protein [Pseudomonas sp. RIT-PI-S]
MSIAHSVVPSLLFIGAAAAVQLLFPQAGPSFVGWLVRIGALIIQL